MLSEELRYRERRSFPSPIIEYEYVWMKHELFYAVSALAGLELLFCICCLAGVFIFKKHSTFANTGLSVIYLFIIGCILSLLSLPLFGFDSELTSALSIPHACMARIWLLTVGFSLSVGILIIRVIYTTYAEMNQNIKTSTIPVSTLTVSVAGLAIVDTIIVIAWRYFSPPHKSYEQKEVELIGLRDERITLVETCTSEKESVILAVFCLYKGGPLLLASVLSLWKRKDEEIRDDDVTQSRPALLSALFTAFAAVPTVLGLPMNPNESFAIGGVLLLLEIVFLMCCIICSKILRAYRCKKGKAVDLGKYSVHHESSCIPCVRATYGCIYNGKQRGFSNEAVADSMFKLQEQNQEELVKPTDDNLVIGVEFDRKESTDILPEDLRSHNEIDMKPYEEKDEEEEEEEEEEDYQVDGETSDENESSSDGESDDENPLEKNAVSVHVEKSSEEESFKPLDSTTSREETPTNPASEQELTTVELNSESCETPTNKKNKSWWKPLFVVGFVKGSKKNSEQDGEILGRNSTLSSEIDSGRYSKSTDCNISLDGSSSSGSDSDSSESD